MTAGDIFVRLLIAAIAGVIIGSERELRQKRAGLRTNVLVALGAAAFCLISASAVNESSSTRIAAQIASGIGFLGAGVIIRDGPNVRGLDTAATLWCSAAVGATAGSGLYLIALASSAAILATNLFLRLGKAVRPAAHEGRTWPGRFKVRIVCRDVQSHDVQARLSELPEAHDVQLEAIGFRRAKEARTRCIVATFRSRKKDVRRVGPFVASLAVLPGVLEAGWRRIDGDPEPASRDDDAVSTETLPRAMAEAAAT